MTTRLRHFGKLKYVDPHGFLVELRKAEPNISLSDTPERIRTLRTNTLKDARERRDAALFCVGMSDVLETKVKFSPVEDQDYDFVATWLEDETQNFCPVQLKEVVPAHLNPNSSIEKVIGKLLKYNDSQDLQVAIKLNRIGKFDPAEIDLPAGLGIGGLWVFGACSEDQSTWALWGDFMRTGQATRGREYSYPT